ncbi:MAG: Eco57I restriction-modification methylase domain-containing protein, partial [Spirochaetes bacterium]|nr:Eco57I restriction-modification methylase domain-containing protein [Spirochaetota bacterium]
TPESGAKLTIQEKAEILKNHIFGVDIDEQAVEVTKLSLMLKMLEGEWGFVKGTAVLPMLDKNIKCGNSLISGNVLELTRYFGNDYYKVKPFNWEEEFRSVMVDEGGFDVVIGNPPYIFARDEGFKKEEKEFFYKTYKVVQYQLNTYIMFTEKSYNLLKNLGRLGFIIPNNWLTIDTSLKFREFILKNTYNIEIVNSYDKVFQDANVDTSILIFSKKGDSNIKLNELINGKILPIIKCETKEFLSDKNLILNCDLIKNKKTINICQKININSKNLQDIVIIKAGIKAYEIGKGQPIQTKEMRDERVYHSTKKINDKYLKYLDGKDVKRYLIDWSGQYIKYGKNLAAPRTPDLFKGERILVRQIPGKLPYLIYSTLVKEDYINDLNSMIIKKQNNDYDLRYILGIINSKLISYWFYFKFGKMQRKIFPQFKIKELSLFPIKPIDFSNIREKEKHDKLCELVSIIIELNEKLKVRKNINTIQKQIEKTNKEIDDLVYDLYGITEEERKIIEGDINHNDTK